MTKADAEILRALIPIICSGCERGASDSKKEAGYHYSGDRDEGNGRFQCVAWKVRCLAEELEAIHWPQGWPEGEWDVLYIDPPWPYKHSRSKSRTIERRYRTMSEEQILALPVPNIAAKNSALYLWVPAPKLVVGLNAMKSWGFTYKTGAAWDKVLMGSGYWFRGQHEHLLVGVRGKFSPPPPAARPRSVLTEPRGRHSKKPDWAREVISLAFPEARKIEIFARDEPKEDDGFDLDGPTARLIRNWRDGWDAWGDEIHEVADAAP